MTLGVALPTTGSGSASFFFLQTKKDELPPEDTARALSLVEQPSPHKPPKTYSQLAGDFKEWALSVQVAVDTLQVGPEPQRLVAVLSQALTPDLQRDAGTCGTPIYNLDAEAEGRRQPSTPTTLRYAARAAARARGLAHEDGVRELDWPTASTTRAE